VAYCVCLVNFFLVQEYAKFVKMCYRIEKSAVLLREISVF